MTFTLLERDFEVVVDGKTIATVHRCRAHPEQSPEDSSWAAMMSPDGQHTLTDEGSMFFPTKEAAGESALQEWQRRRAASGG